jgi:hypothetical protein
VRFSELLPPESNRLVRIAAIPDPRTTQSGCSQENGLLKSWLDDDSDPELRDPQGQVNWTMVSGAALSLTISAGFWAGVALVIERVSR